jgi:hypothetical protein
MTVQLGMVVEISNGLRLATSSLVGRCSASRTVGRPFQRRKCLPGVRAVYTPVLELL